MGKRGPKPTPTATLRLRGSWRGETREGEPEVSVEPVPCPAWVRGSARDFWPELCEVLEGMGLLSKPFSISMGLLVNQLAHYLRVEHEITEETQLIEYGEKASFPNPLFAMRDKAWDRVLKICAEFGLTASSLSGVRSLKQEEKPQGIGRFKLKRG